MPAERTIYVVDDDAAVRSSLEQLLGWMRFITVSYTAAGPFLLAAPDLGRLRFVGRQDARHRGTGSAGDAQDHWIRTAYHCDHRAGRYPAPFSL